MPDDLIRNALLVSVSATYPLVILIVLLIRSITTPGYQDGITFYLVPEWGKLLDPEVCLENFPSAKVSVQCFCSKCKRRDPSVVIPTETKAMMGLSRMFVKCNP